MDIVKSARGAIRHMRLELKLANIFKHDSDNPSPLGLYYNAWFKDATDCSELDRRYEMALSKMPLIFASSELSVYKICHHLFSKFNLKARDIKTVDGISIESYLDPFIQNHKYNIMQVQSMVRDGILKDVGGRWLVIPNMTSQWSPKLAYLFYNEIRNTGTIGIIFHSSGQNNLGKILVEDTLLDVLQFPEATYKQKQQLEDDNY